MINLKAKFKKTNIPIVFSAVLCIIAIILLSICIFQINKKYPNAKKADVLQGQALKLENVELSVNFGRKIYLDKYFSDFDDKDLNPEMYSSVCPLNEQQMLTCKVKINNTSTKAIDFPLYSFVLSSTIWSNGIDVDLFHALNANANLTSSIPANSFIEIELPYVMYRPQFNKKNWDKAMQQQYWLTFNTYPEHIRFII